MAERRRRNGLYIYMKVIDFVEQHRVHHCNDGPAFGKKNHDDVSEDMSNLIIVMPVSRIETVRGSEDNKVSVSNSYG